jgi:competence CoiA-like predicted nuclease
MIGINKFDVTSVRRLTRLKLNHYKLLIENGHREYQDLYNNTERLQYLPDKEIENIIDKELAIHPQPLWWQIIKTD